MTITKKVISVKKDFDLNSTSSCLFHHSQWESCTEEEHVSIPYLIYRVLFMVIFVASLTYSTLCQSYLYHIFLTNWSFTLQTLYGVLFCGNIIWSKRSYLFNSVRLKFNHIYPESSVKAYELKETTNWTNASAPDAGTNGEGKNMMVCINMGNQSKEDELNNTPTTVLTTDSQKKSDIINCTSINNNHDSPSTLEKVIWVLMNVAHVLPHIVAFGYWIFVYKYDPNQLACAKFKSHFIVHGGTSAFALIDALIVAVPARKTHFVFPSFILFIYGLFSFIYEISGGPYRSGKEYIYSILNWRYKPWKTFVIIVVGIIVSPLAHFITCWSVHYLRIKLVSWYKRVSNK